MKTTKSKKTQYRGEIPMLEFIAANPDMTAAEIASALNRGMPSVSGQIRQLEGCTASSLAVCAMERLSGVLTTCRLAAATGSA